MIASIRLSRGAKAVAAWETAKQEPQEAWDRAQAASHKAWEEAKEESRRAWDSVKGTDSDAVKGADAGGPGKG